MNITKEQLVKLEEKLTKRGYRRIDGHYKNENFGYWKSFKIKYNKNNDKIIQYQIAILFYDFSKYDQSGTQFGDKHIGYSYHFVGSDEMKNSIDCYYRKSISVHKFELLCSKLHTFMNTVKL